MYIKNLRNFVNLRVIILGLVDVASLQPGMILKEDVVDINYKIPLACRGVKLTSQLIKKFSYVGIPVVNIELPKEVTEQIMIETSEVLKDIFETVGKNQETDFNKLIPFAEKIVNLIITYGQQVIDEIFLLWKMDQYTFHHSIGTAFFSVLIGNELGYNESQLKDLALGSLLHDLGKGLIPSDILNKPGRLAPHEFDEIKKHPYLGYKILKENSSFNEKILVIPLQHHERKDGNGYPLMLKGDSIHPYAKIVSIADMFSALTTDRVYRNKVSKFVAGEYLIDASNYALDKYLVNVFLYAILRDMKDTWVILSNGEMGKIISVNYKHPTRPKLAIYKGNEFMSVKDLTKYPQIFIKDYLK
jgi:HD-GYP domain-containing protein (c-di-GMP phosphodiesterase class II)